jgi:hypothetical protein
MRITRRSIMRGIGAGAATLFARPLLRQAFGQTGAPPRLLVVCMPNCSIKNKWAPTGGRDAVAGTGNATDFKWGFCNEPLEPVRKYITLLDGLDHKKVGGDPHGSGFIRYTTGGTIQAGENTRDPGAGRLPGDGNLAVLPSVDQLFIQKSPIIGQKGLAIGTGLQLATDTRGRTDGIHFIVMSYSTDLPKPKPMPPENTPYKTYMRIVQVAAPGSSSPEQQAALMKELGRKRSVLDFMKSDLGRLETRLGTQQRTKLESHLTALREYEQSLIRQQTAGPPAPVKIPPTIENIAPNSNANYPKICDQYHDLIKLCFQLDLTRVATLLYGHGNQAYQGLHSVAHGGSADTLAKATNWFMDQTAKYVQRLADTTDLDGQPLIDNMVMTLSSDVSERHDHVNVPYLVAGGKNLGIAGGRLLRYPGYASNDVFSSLLKPFKVELPGNKFGDPMHAKGPLPEFVT